MGNDLKIILASKSPRRREILKNAGIDFEVFVPDEEEKDIIGLKYTDEVVKKQALEKAKIAVRHFIKSSLDEIEKFIIVTCDTVVVNDGIIIGKPKDKEDAFNILRSLSGKEHIVSSAICIYSSGDYKVGNEETRVTFRKLSDEDIINYIDRCKPFDKAGAYGIQDENFDFVEKVSGDIDNVIGFPLKLFYKLYNM